MNPFTRYPAPQSAAQFQSNANYWTYERMAAEDELRGFDQLGIKAPQEVIANAHTSRWVEKEHIRMARKAHAEQNAAAA